MSKLVLDFDADDDRRRRLVYVGDSIGYTPATGDFQANHKRLPSLLAKSLCARGYQEWDGGFDTPQHSFFGWHMDGTAEGDVDDTGVSSGPWDWELYFLTDSGRTAANWPDGPKSFDLEVAAYGGEPCDILVVQFGFNDMNDAGITAGEYETALKARLNEWTDVERKFLIPTYSPFDVTYPRGGINDGKAAYWTGALNAASDANPGNQQDTVALIHTGNFFEGVGIRNGLPLFMLNSDTTHANRIGAQYIARSVTRHEDWPGVRIPY